MLCRALLVGVWLAASRAAVGNAEGLSIGDDGGAPRVGSGEASDIVINDYPNNSLEPAEVWKISRIGPEYRRMGFFTVKLLPVLVAKGIRLDFNSALEQTDWLAGFRCEWAPRGNPAGCEWRDFSIYFPGENTPRLQARRVYPAAKAGPLIGRLEGVTLQAGTKPVYLARAEIWTAGRACDITWRERAADISWDLFSGQFNTNTIRQGTHYETP